MSIPTPEQARELVEFFGSQRKAAEAVGYSASTIRNWLDPEKARARDVARAANQEKYRAYHRARYAANQEKRLAYHRARYYRSKAAGRCVKCGDVAVTETRCWTCADKQKEATAWRH